MGIRDQLRAALSADPQARDTEHDPWATTFDVDRKEPDRGSIDDWTTEYEENPLINVPTQTFVSDILEPGQRVELGIGEDDEPPEVTDFDDEDYNGLELDEALEKWLTEAGIVNGEFDHDIGDVLEKLLKDLVARRGSAIAERVYDDATEQNRLMGIRPFKAETVTAYTREGKSILLRPGDDAEDVDFDQGSGLDIFSPKSLTGDDSRSSLPQTPAGQTACYVQYDDIYGSWDDDEVRFAQDDVVKVANDADTGEIWGTPHAASVYDRAHALRQQYADLDQALKAVSYSHFVAKVATSDQEEAKKLLEGFDPSNPEKINVVNYDVEVDHFAGEVPDIDATLKQEIEYILSAFPVPIYRIGFEGEINRDVTSEQSDDYQRELSDWRNDIGDKFSAILQEKAEEFVPDPPEVELVIAPEEASNPLHDENFDAGEFKTVMEGLKQAGVSLDAEFVLETFLNVNAEDALGEADDGDGDAGDEGAALGALEEADPRVRETFFDVVDVDQEGSA